MENFPRLRQGLWKPILLDFKLQGLAQMFLRFFYPDDWVYEEGGLMEHLFEGHFMVWVRGSRCFTFYTNKHQIAKFIMQGPSQALKAPGTHCGNRGNAAKIGARHITPHLMGYFGFQVCVSISSTNFIVDGLCPGCIFHLIARDLAAS
jgi:hypothetical protein